MKDLVNVFGQVGKNSSVSEDMSLDEIIKEKPNILKVREFFKKIVKKLDKDDDDLYGVEMDEKGMDGNYFR
jgi:hypothetical protein